MSDSVILWTVGSRLLYPWDFPGNNTGVGCFSFSRGSSQPRDQTHGSYVSCVAGRFFTTEPRRKPPEDVAGFRRIRSNLNLEANREEPLHHKGLNEVFQTLMRKKLTATTGNLKVCILL